MTLLAIDPGHAGEGCACAVYADGRLARVWFERFAAPFDGPFARRSAGAGRPQYATVVVERPTYQGARSDAARTGDLINLAWSGALLAGAYAGRDGAELVEYAPSDTRDPKCLRHGRKVRVTDRRAFDACSCRRGWKGSEQKPVHHARLWDVLTEAERDVLGGVATYRRIAAAVQKGALDRWGKPGATYYGSNPIHNLLDAACLGCYHNGRLPRK